MTDSAASSSFHIASRPARQVALVSLVTAVTLAALKLVGWGLSGSVGVLASLADSGLDMLAAAGILFAIGYAAKAPDEEHRFGHGKAEAFASLLQAALIFTSAGLIGLEAVGRLFRPQPVGAEHFALGILVLSTLASAAVATLQTRVLRHDRSIAVQGDRLHYLADVVANLIALAGLVLTWLFSAPRIDALAGLLVAAGLAWGGVRSLKGATDHLMDHELDDEERSLIVALAEEDPDVREAHNLRTRAAGPLVHIQLHLSLDPGLSLVTAHRILIRVERRILVRFPSADILLHPDPEGMAEPHGGAFVAASASLVERDRMTSASVPAREGA